MSEEPPSTADQCRLTLERVRHLSDLKRHDEAAKLLLGLVAHDANDYEALCRLSGIFILKEDMNQAVEFADRAIAAAPDNDWAHRLRSMALRDSNKREALASARRAVELRPATPMALSSLISALIANNKLHEAQIAAEKLLRIAPGDADTYESLSLVAFKRGWWNDAEHFSREALKRDPACTASHYNFGVALFDLKRYDEAALSFYRTLRLDPTYQKARQMTIRSASIFLGDASVYGPIPQTRYAWILFTPGWWIIAAVVIRNTLLGWIDWTSAWIMVSITVSYTATTAFLLIKQHLLWKRLSPEVRSLYFNHRWRWLLRLVSVRGGKGSPS